jgi:predicted RND superfamily exporter protein
MFHLLFERVNKFYEKLFAIYGRFLSKYYKYTIVFSLLLNLILSFGLVKIKIIEDADSLFMPIDSQARRLESRVKYLFNHSSKLTQDFYVHQQPDMGTWTEINFQPIHFDPSNPQRLENILQLKYVDEIRAIHTHLLESTHFINSKNETINFESVCARRFNKCVVDGEDVVSREFIETDLPDKMDKKTRRLNELNNEDQEDEPGDQSMADEFRFHIRRMGMVASLTDLSYTLGKEFTVNAYNMSLSKEENSKNSAYANVIKLRYSLRAYFSDVDENVKGWEAKFIANLQEMLQKKSPLIKNVKLSFGGSQSLDLEMNANLSIDTILIVGTFILIILFSIILMSINSNCLTSPGFMLPMSGILCAVFGMTSSFGLLAYLNYPGCKLILVIPFLVIGIGIDDMFIMYSSYLHTYNNRNKSLKSTKNDVIMHTLAKSGVSITITSLTDLIAFLVGVTTDFKSVQIFCLYAGVSILFCYLYQIFFFAGFLCIHLERIERNCNACFICVKQEKLNKIFPNLCAKFICLSEQNAQEEMEMSYLDNETGIFFF